MGLFGSVKHSKHHHSTKDKNKDDGRKDHRNLDGSHHHWHADVSSNGKLVKKQGLNSASAAAIREKDASAAVEKLVMSLMRSMNSHNHTAPPQPYNSSSSKLEKAQQRKYEKKYLRLKEQERLLASKLVVRWEPTASNSRGAPHAQQGEAAYPSIMTSSASSESMGQCCIAVIVNEFLEELFLSAADFVDTNCSAADFVDTTCSAAALRRKAACFGCTVTSGQDPTNDPEAELYAEHSYAQSYLFGVGLIEPGVPVRHAVPTSKSKRLSRKLHARSHSQPKSHQSQSAAPFAVAASSRMVIIEEPVEDDQSYDTADLDNDNGTDEDEEERYGPIRGVQSVLAVHTSNNKRGMRHNKAPSSSLLLRPAGEECEEGSVPSLSSSTDDSSPTESAASSTSSSKNERCSSLDAGAANINLTSLGMHQHKRNQNISKHQRNIHTHEHYSSKGADAAARAGASAVPLR
jgi:hypothetical protein